MNAHTLTNSTLQYHTVLTIVIATAIYELTITGMVWSMKITSKPEFVPLSESVRAA